jgi:hypothetical protein
LFVRAFMRRAMLMLDSRHGDDFVEVTSTDLFHLLGVSKSLTSHQPSKWDLKATALEPSVVILFINRPDSDTHESRFSRPTGER